MLNQIVKIHFGTTFLIRILLVLVALLYLINSANAQTVKKTAKIKAKQPIQTARYIEPEIISRASDEMSEKSAPKSQAKPAPNPESKPTPPITETQENKDNPKSKIQNPKSDYRYRDRDLPELGRVGVDLTTQKTLTLRDALEKALANNKDIEVSRQNVKLAEFDFKVTDGFYDPRISGQTYFERASTANTSPFSAIKTQTQNNIFGNLRFEGNLRRFGSSYRAELTNQRLATNNTFSPLSPQTTTNLSFTFTQPLRRGKKIDTARRSIEIAKKNLSLTDTQFRQKTIDTITAVQRAYWDLTYSLKNLQVQRDAVKDTKEQLASNQRRVDEGILAPIDVVAVETQVANLEQGVYLALDDVNRAENALKNLMSPNRNDEIWGFSLIPTDKIELEIQPVALPEAMQAAIENRPELQINEVAKEINEIDRKFYKDQTKSQVDLFATYTTSGIGGSQNSSYSPPQFPGAPPPDLGYLTGSSLTDLFANRYPTFRVGVTINLPLKNTVAEAQLGKNLVEGEKLKTQREQIEQTIQVDVRNSLQALRTAQARLRAAAISRENSEKQYESEKRKLEEGQSTVFLVLERQTALTNAKGSEIKAQTDLNKALAELQRATGNSLRANGITTVIR